MSRFWVCWVALTAAVLLGCGRTSSYPPDKVWTEAKTDHFWVQSDLKPDELESLALGFERSYAALKSYVLPGGGELPGESRVIALATKHEYRLIQVEDYAAFFRSRSGLYGSSQEIVFSYEDRDAAMEVFQHELVHRFVAHYFPAAPVWVNEGLAQYLSSATVRDDEVEIGLPVRKYTFDGWQWQRARTPFADVWPDFDALRQKTGTLDSSEYAGAWALVHTLLLGEPRHRAAFGGYMSELHEGQLSEPDAFAKHLDASALAELRVAYRAFPKQGNLPTEKVKLRSTKPALSLRTLTRAEAYALWGEIRPNDSVHRPLALQDAEEAIASAPESSVGYVLRGSLHFSAKDRHAAERDLRRAVALEPERREAVHALTALLLQVDGPTPEVAALAERLRSLARRADDHLLLARWELAAGRPGKARDLALAAVASNRGCHHCYRVASLAAARQLDFDAAIRWQTMAINIAAERASPAMRLTLRKLQAARAKR